MDAMTNEPCRDHTHRTALVTGASSGIGRATVETLIERGWRVIATARRADRLAELTATTGAVSIPCDLTDEDAREELLVELETLAPIHALVNVAGGAIGVDSIEDGSADDWRRMFEINVIATKELTAGMLPILRASAADDKDGFPHADIITVTSTAAVTPYEGGAGYNAAKAAEHMLVKVLRLELAGEPIRVMEVLPGLVHTEEFSTVRLRGDAAAAAKVYEGVDHPLTADDIALAIAQALELPGHFNVDEIMVRPVAQAAQHKLVRGPLTVREPNEGASE